MSENRWPPNLKLILPVGTQVVTLVEVHDGERLLHPQGAVAVIVKSPVDLQHPYRVRFVDGFEELLMAYQLVMLSKFVCATRSLDRHSPDEDR